MDMSQLDPALREWAYAREVMRCLGFTPDELFFQINIDTVDKTTIRINLLLQSQGKIFTWGIGKTKIPRDKIAAAYEDLCSNWNTSDGDNLQDFRESRPYQSRMALIGVLQNRGFEFDWKDAEAVDDDDVPLPGTTPMVFA